MSTVLEALIELPGREADYGPDYTRKYKRRFQAQTINPWIGPSALLVAMVGQGLAIGGIYDTAVPDLIPAAPLGQVTFRETDPASFCLRIVPRCVTRDGLTWEIDVEYGWQDPVFWPVNPLDKPIEVSWDFAQFEEPATETEEATPKPVANTAGEAFDPPPMRDDSRPILTIVRNERYFDETSANTYKDAVNSDTFVVTVSPFEQYTFAPNTVKVSNISSRRVLDPNVPVAPPYSDAPGYYWQTTYQFHINDETWDKLIDNVGLRQLVGGSLKPILLADGTPVSSPAPLNSSGVAVLDGTPAQPIAFKVYKAMPFAGFNFA